MEFSEYLYQLSFPAKFEQRLNGIYLRENSRTCPVLLTLNGNSEKGKVQNFHPATINALENRLELSFEQEVFINGKVCFANTEEVRPDFRTTFTAGELLNYIFALLPASKTIDVNRLKVYLPFPEDSDHFWKLVQLGQRKKGTIE